MDIGEILRSVLDPIAPTEADAYEGKKSVYITFNYNTIPDNFGDDEPEDERALIQVHLYAPIGWDTTKMRQAVKKAIHGAGMTWPRCINASDRDGQHHVFECEAAWGLGEE